MWACMDEKLTGEHSPYVHALPEKRECTTCTLPENARSFQGVQEISHIYLGNLWTPWKLRAFSGSVQVAHSLFSCSDENG